MRVLIFLLCVLISGCATPPPSLEARLKNADTKASSAGWAKQRLDTQPVNLVAYTPATHTKSSILTVYIEGDGLSWISRSKISSNPTPIDPVGLSLALKHGTGAAAYLARPCQFRSIEQHGGCSQDYWSLARFSPDVVSASQQAINLLMQQAGANQLQLVGYSGGGTIATLLAARRNDVIKLVTIAGNLDHQYWTRMHHVTPLKQSLNPVNDWQTLKNIPQIHLVGGMDKNISREVAYSYQSHFPPGSKPTIKVIENFDHSCCWVDEWQKLILQLDL